MFIFHVIIKTKSKFEINFVTGPTRVNMTTSEVLRRLAKYQQLDKYRNSRQSKRLVWFYMLFDFVFMIQSQLGLASKDLGSSSE